MRCDATRPDEELQTAALNPAGRRRARPSVFFDRSRFQVSGAALLGLAACLLVSSPAPAWAEPSTGHRTASAFSRFASLPLFFEENLGQTDDSVRFIARGSDHTVYLRDQGATIALRQEGAGAKTNHLARIRQRPATASDARLIHFSLPGSKRGAAAFPGERAAGRINYLLGNRPADWQTGVATFGRVRYEGVYPGIDLVYYGNQQQLEYDFVVAPGADPSAIELRFDGADRLEIDAKGDLVLHVGPGELRQHKPIVYQSVAGVRRDIPGQYRIKDARTVTFEIGTYDRTHSLVIDPILSYSTYLGGRRGDIGWAIAVDGNGSAYVAGDTMSVIRDLPVPGGPPTYSGGSRYGGDAFVARIDPDPDTNSTSIALGYLTYLGGRQLETATGIAVDSGGNAYVTGYTVSTNFPTFNNDGAGVPQPEIGGEEVPGYPGEAGYGAPYPDAFVTKLDPTGAGVYSTFLGAELSESGADIAVDAGGSAYVVGFTDSVLTFIVTNEIATARCTNGLCGAPKISKKVTTASLLVPSQVVSNYVRTDFTSASTNVVYTQVTTTLLSPLTTAPILQGLRVVNAIQTNNASVSLFIPQFKRDGSLKRLTEDIVGADLFLAKISADGSALNYFTYLGGVFDDFGTGIGVDALGQVTVSGWTVSDDLPVTNAIQSQLLGRRDGLVAKLNAAGSGLLYLTYLGGSQNDSAYSLALDSLGAAYVAGLAGSPDFPSTPGALNRGGVFGSSNAGTNWTFASQGLTHPTVNAVAADPSNPGTFYAGTPRGVFKTVNSGATWSDMSTGLTTRAVLSLAVDPATPSTVYAGTTADLFTSTNGGLDWIGGEVTAVDANGYEFVTFADPGLPLTAVRSIYIEPAAPTNVFIATASGIYQRSLFTNFVGHVWDWRSAGLRSRSVHAVVPHPSLALLYAVTDGGIHVSTNRGTNWRASNTGLKSTRTRALVVDPVVPETLYVGTLRGFHKSINGGTNWFILTNGLGRPVVNSLAIDPASPSIIYAGTTNGLFLSGDGGTNWTPSNTGFQTRNIASITFDPAVAGGILVGTRGTNFAGGSNDVFLAKLAPDGSALEYALTFGGSRNDEGWDVAVDANGSAFVTGQTASRNFPVVGLITNLPAAGSVTNVPASPTNYHGRIDAFVAGFDPAGSNTLFSFYLGGRRNDFGHGIAADGAHGIYVVGRTESSGFATNNALRTTDGDPVSFGGGRRDAFVAKLLTGDPLSMIVLSPSGDQVVVSWAAPAPEYTLESRESGTAIWTPVAQKPEIVNGRHTVVLPAGATTSFFRLRAGKPGVR